MKQYEYLAHHGSPEQIIQAFEEIFLMNADLEHENELLTKENNKFADKITEQENQITQLQITLSAMIGLDGANDQKKSDQVFSSRQIPKI